MTEELYREVLLDVYAHPRFKKSLPGATHTGRAVNTSCGDEGTLFLKIESGRVLDVSWQGNGCVISTAAMETVCELLLNSQLSSFQSMNKQSLLEKLELTSIAPGREKCLLLALRALDELRPEQEEQV